MMEVGRVLSKKLTDNDTVACHGKICVVGRLPSLLRGRQHHDSFGLSDGGSGTTWMLAFCLRRCLSYRRRLPSWPRSVRRRRGWFRIAFSQEEHLDAASSSIGALSLQRAGATI